jgi:hypothetical protein
VTLVSLINVSMRVVIECHVAAATTAAAAAVA